MAKRTVFTEHDYVVMLAGVRMYIADMPEQDLLNRTPRLLRCERLADKLGGKLTEIRNRKVHVTITRKDNHEAA